MTETKPKGRPTTETSLKKLGFEVLSLNEYHAHLAYKGVETRMKGESAKELLAIAKGWLEHVSASR